MLKHECILAEDYQEVQVHRICMSTAKHGLIVLRRGAKLRKERKGSAVRQGGCSEKVEALQQKHAGGPGREAPANSFSKY
jgi:hypothetical protein